MLLDDDFARMWGNLRINLDAWLAVHQARVACDWSRRFISEAPQVTPIPPVDMSRVNDSDTSFAAEGEGAFEGRQHGPPGRRFQGSAHRDEVILHIHHDHSCLAGVNGIGQVWHS